MLLNLSRTFPLSNYWSCSTSCPDSYMISMDFLQVSHPGNEGWILSIFFTWSPKSRGIATYTHIKCSQFYIYLQTLMHDSGLSSDPSYGRRGKLYPLFLVNSPFKRSSCWVQTRDWYSWPWLQLCGESG